MTATRSWWKPFLMLALCLVAIEAACQIYAWHVARKLDAIRSRPNHYYRLSDNPVLGYELDPGRVIETDGRMLRINQFGIRDDSDAVPEGVTKMALLGDSVVFGTGFSQEFTISGLLQRELNAATNEVRVLNFGVPGYNLAELLEFLKVKDRNYHVDHVVYILNPNDFCRRDTRYEGADNGLYRMYHLPRLKSPWFLGKLVYRIRKEGMVSVGWYRWLYAGCRDSGLENILRMAQYCRSRDCPFSVILLPAGCAYADGAYALDRMHADIADWLKSRGIDSTDTVNAFRPRPAEYFTNTDHLTVEGNKLMAEIIADGLREGPPASDEPSTH